jgi:hypothetical protein
MNLILGAISGVGLALLTFFLFQHPQETGTGASLLASFLLVGFAGWLFMFRLRLPPVIQDPYTWIIRGLLVLFILSIAIFSWPTQRTAVTNFLSPHPPRPGWLTLVGLILGSGLGSALSSFKFFARYKNLVLAVLFTLLNLALPIAVLLSVGAFRFSFQP